MTTWRKMLGNNFILVLYQLALATTRQWIYAPVRLIFFHQARKHGVSVRLSKHSHDGVSIATETTCCVLAISSQGDGFLGKPMLHSVK